MSALPIEIIRGRSKAIDLYLADALGRPIDLTSLTQMKAEVHAATGIPIEITLTGTEIIVVGDPKLGHAQLQFPASKTLLFGLTGYDAETSPLYTTLQIQLTITSNPDFNPGIQKVANALNITDPIS